MPGSRVHGGKHARALFAGLREILCENGCPLGQHARQETCRCESGSDRPTAKFTEHICGCSGVVWFFRLHIHPKECLEFAWQRIPSGRCCWRLVLHRIGRKRAIAYAHYCSCRCGGMQLLTWQTDMACSLCFFRRSRISKIPFPASTSTPWHRSTRPTSTRRSSCRGN